MTKSLNHTVNKEKTIMKLTFKIATASMLLAFSAGVYASGSEFYGSKSSYGSSSTFSSKKIAKSYKKEVDQLYEKGKARYYATNSNGQRTRYCVRKENAVESVSRRSLKDFRGTSEAAVKSNLVLCDLPEQNIASTLENDQATALVYYLNKRYRLGLYGS